MRIVVKLYGTLRRFSNPSTPGFWTGEIHEHSKIKDLIGILEINKKEIALSTINGAAVDIEEIIPEESEIIFVSHVGAG